MHTYVDILIGFAAYRPVMWLSRAIVDPIFDRYWPVDNRGRLRSTPAPDPGAQSVSSSVAPAGRTRGEPTYTQTALDAERLYGAHIGRKPLR